MEVEVFKTNVNEANISRRLTEQLLKCFPASKVNFDLEDCDNVLRVEGTGICPKRIIELLNHNGHHCEVLK
ncbi:hypothetical protein FFF34_012135 [Inquilinus sp. KBS0705]|nr:hypothetical protein FFF34_012135 [Inquilinus sp. KBS0705]